MRFRLTMLAGLMALAAPAAVAEDVIYIKVYFAWGVTKPDKAAVAVIDAALPRIKACEANGVSVIGHADTSHTQEESSLIASERGRAVRDLLLAKGLRNSAVGFTSKSENDLAVPTKDGVREAKNRRAEIRLVCD